MSEMHVQWRGGVDDGDGDEYVLPVNVTKLLGRNERRLSLRGEVVDTDE